jgi:hypothetical protein
MNWRKHMVLMAGGGLALLLLVVSLFFLVRFQGQYSTTTGQLESAYQRLQQLNNRDPFPSAENVEKTKRNLDEVRRQAGLIRKILMQNQIKGEEMEPAEFAPLLEKSSRRLQQKAQESGVVLPSGFAFGFPRYAEGALPSKGDVFRLVAQLRAVEAVCDVLFQANITQLDALERQVFDEAVAGEPVATESRRGRRGTAESAPVSTSIPLTPSNALYSAERIIVSVQGRETAIWDTLNAVVRHPSFMVLVDVHLDNTLALAGTLGKKVSLPTTGGDGGKPLQFPTHDDRIVSGRELVSATLVIDLYHFNRENETEESP